MLGSEIRIRSRDAERAALGYASVALERWFERVRASTEAEFIPWATGYWTHQWLALKLAWYRSDDSIDEPARMARLANYLYEEYRSKVLEPVAHEIDPTQIMDQASEVYASTLATNIEELRQRYQVPRRTFDAWLSGFPAISAPPGASLRDLIEAQTVTELAAYQALTAPIRNADSNTGLAGGPPALRAVAERTAERLATTLTVRGGAAAASVLGGVPGALLGIGVSAWDAAAYEQERPALAAALSSELDAALRTAQWHLLSDRRQGVLAPIAHITEQLAASLPAPLPPFPDEAGEPEALF